MSRRVPRSASRRGADQLLLWVVRAGVLLVLVVPLIVTPGTLFPFVVGKALFARMVIEVTLALWLLLIFFYPQHRPTKSWVLLAFGLWLLVSTLAAFAGVSLVRSLWSTYERMQGVVDLAHWFAFIVVAGSTFRTFADWRLLFTINLALCALVSALGLGQYYGLWDQAWLLWESPERLASTVGNPIYMGTYTSVSAIIGLSLLLQSLGHQDPERVQQRRRGTDTRRRHRRSKRRNPRFDYWPWLRAFWVLAILVSLWALWLTASRGAALGLVVGMIAFALGHLNRQVLPALRWASYGILVAAIAAVTFFIVARSSPILDPLVESSAMMQRLTSISIGSAQGRAVATGAGLRAYLDKPLLGWGPENFIVAWGRYFDAESGVDQRFDQAHNKVVETITTTGASGLLSYLLIWGAMAAVVIRSLRRRQSYDRMFVSLLGATLVAYFVQNLVSFETPTTMMLFAILVAFVMSEEGWVRRHDAAATQQRASGRVSRQPSLATSYGPLATGPLVGLLRTSWGATLLVLVVAAVTVGSLLLLNVRLYAAAAAVLQARTATTSWAEQVTYFNRSIERFPGLANYPRIYMITATAKGIGTLPEAEFEPAVDLVTAVGQQGLAAEPESWRLQVTLAQFYQATAARKPEYLAVARGHVKAAVRLAPKTLDTLTVRNVQERGELCWEDGHVARPVPPAPGTALAFDGVDDTATVDLDLSDTSVVSVDFWVRAPSTSGPYGRLLEFTAGHNRWILRMSSTPGNLGVYLDGTGGIRWGVWYNDVLETPWQHLVVIMDRGSPPTITVYHNGVQLTLVGHPNTDNVTGVFGTGTLALMSRGGTNLFGGGELDELRIYRRALTASEVAARYAAGRGVSGGADADLVAGWHFDDGNGMTASDYSGNEHPLTLAGGPRWVAGHVALPAPPGSRLGARDACD